MTMPREAISADASFEQRTALAIDGLKSRVRKSVTDLQPGGRVELASIIVDRTHESLIYGGGTVAVKSEVYWQAVVDTLAPLGIRVPKIDHEEFTAGLKDPGATKPISKTPGRRNSGLSVEVSKTRTQKSDATRLEIHALRSKQLSPVKVGPSESEGDRLQAK